MRVSRRWMFGTVVWACVFAVGLTRGNPEHGIEKPDVTQALPSFAEPAISPDGTEIAFVSGGDIWTVRSGGGEAHLLISNPATESRPLYSPDGRFLAFISTRTGGGDIYMYTFASGEVRRLTFDDGLEQLDAWSPDSRWLYFSSISHDIAAMNDIYRVSAEGGTPMPVSDDRYVNEFFAAPSPDGRTLAFSARGIASSQWWRKGHSHLDESEIWLWHDTATPYYERVTEGGAKQVWPMWSRDGKTLYYVSDRGGAQNIWSQIPGQTARQITPFKDGRVLWPTLSSNGKTLVFERNFGIWKMDVASGRTAEVPIMLRGAPAGPSTEHSTLSNQFQELALSPDGKKVAFIVHGEVFAVSAKDGGDALRVTQTPEKESDVSWSADSKKLAYVSNRGGIAHVFVYDFTTNQEVQVTNGTQDDATPTFSPDGRWLAYERHRKELHILELDSKQDRTVATGFLELPPLNSERPLVWSPDNRWIAFAALDGRMFRNIRVVAVAGGEAKPISFLGNGFGNTVSWSPDGRYILFDTGQRTEIGQVVRVDLIPRQPKFREDQFRDLFKEELTKPGAPTETKSATPEIDKSAAESRVLETSAATKKPPVKPVEIVFENIRERLTALPIGLDVQRQVISPDGKWLLVNASSSEQDNLYVYSLDELSKEPAVARQLTSTALPKRAAQFSPDSKEVFYLEGGRIQTISLETRQPKPLAATAEMDVDFNREKMEVFEEAWTIQRDNFFQKDMNGVDWKAIQAQYEPHIAGARTSDELRRLLSLMVGELNASHSGVSGPPGSAPMETGKAGLRFDRREFESAGHLRIAEVIPNGPAALTHEIKTGDFLLAVDGIPVTPHTNFDERLNHKINRRVVLSIAASPDGSAKHDVALRPMNQAAEKGLIYRAWVEKNREYVERTSHGRLGYVHMSSMSAGALQQLYLDLDSLNTSKDGVVIDVRNNNGGFVNAYALDALARRGYLTFTVRDFPSSPARSVLGQRSLEKPTILITNQHSLSDAEDFTEGYRALHLGKVVGEPTAGWIIYTDGESLIDGTIIRIPFMKVTDNHGQPMEMHPRPVDIPVTRPIGETYSDHDNQLDAAIKELLEETRK